MDGPTNLRLDIANCWRCCACGCIVERDTWSDDCPSCPHQFCDDCEDDCGRQQGNLATSICIPPTGLVLLGTTSPSYHIGVGFVHHSNSDMWRCCQDDREVVKSLNGNTCPDCGHDKCDSCTDPLPRPSGSIAASRQPISKPKVVKTDLAP